MMRRNISCSEAGFNLMEVMIAMALLGTVLLSIATLFFMGQSNIYSGKQLTRATAAAVHANEDVTALSPTDLFKDFAIDKTVTKGSNTVAGVTYASSIVRTTDQAGTSVDVNPPQFLTQWKSLLTADRVLSGHLSMILLPQQQTDSNDVTTARLIQVRIVAEWQEGPRNRNVVIDTTKWNRF